MSEKKNIERLFQEKFKDFEAIPSQKVWDNIEEELHKKKKRKVIPIWFRLSGVAALLLVGALIGYGILNDAPKTNPINGVVNQENINSENNGSGMVPTKNPVQNNQVVTDAGNIEGQNNTSENAITTEEINGENNSGLDQNLKTKASQGKNIKNNAVASQGNDNINSSGNKIKYNNKKVIGAKNNAVANNQKDKADTNSKTQNINSENNAIANSDLNQNRSKTAVSENDNAKNKALANQEKSNTNRIISSENKSNFQEKVAIADNKTTINKNSNTQIALDTKAIEEQKKDSTAVATVAPNALEELLKQQEKEKELVAETKMDRWQITSNVAPIYFSSASGGSPISDEFSDNGKEYERNLSYGVGVNYALSKKWAVRGGVNKLTLGYNTNNIVYYPGLSDVSARSANTFQAKGSPIIIEDNTASNVISLDNIPGKNVGHLNQKMGFIEVPLELSYKLLDRKFGIEVIGGMSTLFLSENNLSVVSSGFTASAGKAENLNDISFSSNIGLGFKYKFWKSFQANVEPKFKYQLNTFSNNDGGFKPYFIGIYSGLSFSF